MDDSQELEHGAEQSTRSRATKRKWREIEMLKERYSLLKELEGMDYCSSYELDDLDF